MKKLKNINWKELDKKKLAIIAGVALLLVIIVCFVVTQINKTDSMNGLKITYNDGKVIKFGNFKNDFSKEKTITVVNQSKENKTFSLEWEGVENNLDKQNTFTYEISCTGDRCATLGTSQVPVAGFKVFPQVLIEAGKTQVYTIKFNYSGSEKSKDFKGSLRIYSEEVKEEEPVQKEKKADTEKTKQKEVEKKQA